MSTTTLDAARRLLRRTAPCVLVLASAACSCPPRVEGYASPERTLARWQASLCRDDLVAEYACLAASYQRRIDGFPNYHAARAALLEEHPAAAWLFERTDLADHVEELAYSPDGLTARIDMTALGQRVIVSFELETWVTVHWADGGRQSLRQERPLERLLGHQGGRTWLDIQRPEIPPERRQDVRSLSVDLRWKIADISGLAPVDARAAAHLPPPDPGPLP